jgi:predicted RNase H-like nuclease
VVERLEQLGYHSLEQLRRAGPDEVSAAVCAMVGSSAWSNRRRAIWRAVEKACSDYNVGHPDGD